MKIRNTQAIHTSRLEEPHATLPPIPPAPVTARRLSLALDGLPSAAQRARHYDLEPRTIAFALAVRRLVQRLPRTLANLEDARRLLNSSAAIGANYLEANEVFCRKDFPHRVKICRKDSKVSRYWLQLLELGGDPQLEAERLALIREAASLASLFGAILRKAERAL